MPITTVSRGGEEINSEHSQVDSKKKKGKRELFIKEEEEKEDIFEITVTLNCQIENLPNIYSAYFKSDFCSIVKGQKIVSAQYVQIIEGLIKKESGPNNPNEKTVTPIE